MPSCPSNIDHFLIIQRFPNKHLDGNKSSSLGSMHHCEAARSWHTKLGFGFRHRFSTLVLGVLFLGVYGIFVVGLQSRWIIWLVCVCVMILVSSCRYCSILIWFVYLFWICLQVILLSKVRFIDLRLMQATPAWCSWNMSGSANLELAPHGSVAPAKTKTNEFYFVCMYVFRVLCRSQMCNKENHCVTSEHHIDYMRMT